jgi:hypothetical protein
MRARASAFPVQQAIRFDPTGCLRPSSEWALCCAASQFHCAADYALRVPSVQHNVQQDIILHQAVQSGRGQVLSNANPVIFSWRALGGRCTI